MPTDFLTQIVQQKGRDISQARKKVSEVRLAELARQRSDFRPFFGNLSRPGAAGVNIIAEIKRASPSKGDICPNLDASQTAAQYEKGGAAAVSVLTDPTYFKGSLDDLKTARSACTLPALRKEFIISRYQVYESAAAGVDAVLLIARILNPAKLNQLYSLCRELGMDALVEIHTPEDAEAVAATDARLVGINNRNLSTFETDIAIAIDLVSRLSPGQVPVAASGILSTEDVRKNLSAGIFNFLVGESIVRSGDPVRFIRELKSAGSGDLPFSGNDP
ncbi:MAG: indole-3-glycerol phosphate synthase TrpC [Desulfosarcina sp.]|nr:indole-3-glycerol phosphate synthase TrpC [Desulfosarcina sp.]MBC2744056.1 indole-3-glycerol phosphate synthase TrpC [Desulfosarcina sp.]MBC2766965.1 indole-3-glycerol phosphate synthase TrpC [Desulfosarcina sp.]